MFQVLNNYDRLLTVLVDSAAVTRSKSIMRAYDGQATTAFVMKKSTTMTKFQPPHLFATPLEIRQEIFYLALLAQFDHHKNGACNLIRLDPYFELPRPDRSITHYGGWLFPSYWGFDVSCNLYPVSKQWYWEIQQVLYHKFVFDLVLIKLRTRPPNLSCGLGFLPTRAFQYIRLISLTLKEEWNILTDESVRSLEREHQLLAKHLPKLSAVGFRFDCAREGCMEDYKTGRALLSSDRRSKIVSMMLTLTRPFKHVLEIVFIFWDEPVYTMNEAWPKDSPAVPWEDLVLECAKLLDGERALISRSIGGKKLKLIVGNEGSLEDSIWEPEVFSNKRLHDCYRCFCSLS
jgi:hypothetical protein